MVEVVVAEGRDMARSLFKFSFEGAGMKVVATVGHCADVLGLVERERPDVLLLDFDLPGRGAVEVLRELRSAQAGTRTLVVAAGATEQTLTDVFAAGASGLMLKSCSTRELAASVRTVARGKAVVSAEFIPWLVERAGRAVRSCPGESDRGKMDSLTFQDRRVLVLLSEGLTNNEIALRLGVAPATAKTYVSRLLQRTEMSNRTKLALWAARLESAGALSA
ncbi:response regulator [Streptomyces sp. NPDC050504]|uniref:response regulator n=1 Tax=Streptomyces sp. NPDC050504 TaxID=3365618 RepID=UPI0037BA59A7